MDCDEFCLAVHHKSGHLVEIVQHDDLGFFLGIHRLEGSQHVGHPSVSGCLVDFERHMSHTESRMAALLAVRLRAAEILREEEVEAPFRSGQIFFGVHRSEQGVLLHPLIKLFHQLDEKRLPADGLINIHRGRFPRPGAGPAALQDFRSGQEAIAMSSPDWVREALASTRLLSNLSDELMDQLATSFVERTYQKDEAIFHQGDPGDALFVIASGQVRVEKEILDGTPVTLALRGPGAVIGELALLDGAPRSATVYALEMVKGLSLARSSFITFLGDNNEALKSLLGILSQRLRESDQKIEDLGSKTLVQRLGGVLLQLAETEGKAAKDGIVLSSTVNYQLLTGLLCTNRESVSRAVRGLRDEGLLDKSGRSFLLRDPQGLSDLYHGD